MAKSQKKRDIPAGATAVATNRVARRDYDILDEIEFGIMLKGSEVKSPSKIAPQAAPTKLQTRTLSFCIMRSAA